MWGGADEFEAHEQAEDADVSDGWVLYPQLVEAASGVVAEGGGIGDEAFVVEDVEDGIGGGAGHGVLFVGVVAEGGVAGDVEVFPREEGGEGEDGAAEALPEDEHVGDDVVMLAGEEPAGAPEADGDLVEDEEGAMAVAGGADPAPVVRGRDEGGAADGLTDDGGDVAFLFEDVFDVVGALEGAGGATAEGALEGFGRGDVFATGEEGADALAEDGLAADGDRVEGGAVEGVPHGDELEAAGGDAGELEGHADGGRAARGEEDAVEITRGCLGEATGQGDGGVAGVAARAEAQGVELLADGVEDAGMAVSDLVDVVAVEVEDAAAFDVLDPGAVGMSDGIEAGGGQGLVEEDVGIPGELFAGGRGQVGLGEDPASGREVDVTFGAEGVEVR